MAQKPPQRPKKSKRYRKYITFALLLLPVVVLAIWWFVVGPGPNTRRPGDILRQLGYLELLPPSRFHAPGTINTVEKRGDGTIQLHPTCEINEEKLAPLLHVSQGPEYEIFARELSSKFDATANVLNRFASTAGGNKIQRVTISFQNVQILLVTDEALVMLQQEYIRDSCEQAILKNRYVGAEVCQTKAVLQANLIYKLVYKEEVNDIQRAELTDRISASLNFSTGSSNTDEIRGDNLFYGIKLAERCIVLPGEEQSYSPSAAQSHFFGFGPR